MFLNTTNNICVGEASGNTNATDSGYVDMRGSGDAGKDACANGSGVTEMRRLGDTSGNANAIVAGTRRCMDLETRECAE